MKGFGGKEGQDLEEEQQDLEEDAMLSTPCLLRNINQSKEGETFIHPCQTLRYKQVNTSWLTLYLASSCGTIQF